MFWLIRTRRINKYGYVCEPRFTTMCWPLPCDNRTFEEVAKSAALIGSGGMTDIRLLDCAEIPYEVSRYGTVSKMLANVALYSDATNWLSSAEMVEIMRQEVAACETRLPGTRI